VNVALSQSSPVTDIKRKHSERSSDDDPSSDTPLPRKRGRPRKKQPSDKLPPKPRGRPRKTIEDPESRQFLVPVFVEIAVAPKLVRGRTPRGDKLVKQPPSIEGPFNLTPGMGWDAFITEIANVVGFDKENLIVSTMTWSFQRKAVLPLTSEDGYKTMIQQIRVLKDPSAAIIVISLPAPWTKAIRSQNINDEEVLAMRHEDNSLWGKKVRVRKSNC
jgi:hypothetical protein